MRRQVEVYVDRHGEWRWRFRARNGRVTAVSSESYERRGGALRGARATVGGLVNVVDVEWSDANDSLDPLDDARESLERARDNTDRADARADRAQETLSAIRRLTGLGK